MGERQVRGRLPARYVAVGVGLAAVIALAGFVAASGPPEPDVPKTTPRRLVAAVAEALAARRPLSGWVATHVDLGLPALPQGASEGPLSFAGDHRLRVWQSPAGLRIADVLPLSERVLVVGPSGAWTWDSESFRARRLADPVVTSAAQDLGGMLSQLDPTALAGYSLRLVSPSTEVGLGSPARVAGRDAHVLILRPRSDATLVDRVAVSIDERTRVPLAVEVFGSGLTRPSLSAEFESVSYKPVAREMFEFSPPPGAIVEKSSGHARSGQRHPPHSGAFRWGQARVFGSGWASVLAIPLPTSPSDEPGESSKQLPLPASVTPFSGPLFSADIVEASSRRWLLVGAVPPERLQRARSRL